MKKLIKKVFPKKFRQKIRLFFVRLIEEEATIAEGWEVYAQDHKASTPLGEEWNNPELIGLDVSADQIVNYLDSMIFEPFIGKCDTILEIGAGGGRFSEILLPKCEKLIVSDTSKTMIEFLEKRFAAETGVKYMLLDGTGFPEISDSSIDAAFSYGVFVHLQHWDTYNYLTELKRVLKPGGKAIIHHANTFSEKGWKKFLMDVPRSLNRHRPKNNFTVMNEQIIKEFAERAGLKLENCITDIVKRDCISLITAPQN